MPYVLLDDFEEGPDGIPSPGDSAGTTLARHPALRALDTYPREYTFARARTGSGVTPGMVSYVGSFAVEAFEGSWIARVGQGARVSLGLQPANGLGYAFRRSNYFATPTEIGFGATYNTTPMLTQASLSWVDQWHSWGGGIYIVTAGSTSTLTVWWSDDEADASSFASTVLPISTPAAPPSGGNVLFDWVEMYLARSGWSVKMNGVTLASGPLPRNPDVATFPLDGKAFRGVVSSNLSTVSSDSRANPTMFLDVIGGEPGLWRPEDVAEGEPDTVRRTFFRAR